MDYLKSFGITTGQGNHQEEVFYGLILVYNVLFNRIAGYLQSRGLTPAQFNILIIVDLADPFFFAVLVDNDQNVKLRRR